ncbi:MAG TPA: guanylate kinase [Anaerolineaceae bacterium]|jgi:guanylate kinase|nr:guanylate kinase [Anaerolineaceae bacterium]HNS36844.1 guanylate kinase [Anaerolineaceae bacterium]HNZ12971.1 guanylate kinase [Anaerolineaceae bacterium]HOD06226.1 guanylate kinase [Anaerolineaceae bacterium]HOG79469.1 guanylate kinase [Anaerolineaceae bacterium]
MCDNSLSFDLLHPHPLLIVISGPSGVGKDSVLQALKARNLPMHFVVTATTRSPRPEEKHGVDYFFVSLEEFERMIAEDELIEHAIVYNQYKGIPKAQIREAFASGKDVVLRVDVQGAARLQTLYPNALMIFLLPSNEQEWIDRLRRRNTETPENLVLRVETARKEIESLPRFDYMVVNAEDRLEQAADTIVAIIQAEHHKVCHRIINV